MEANIKEHLTCKLVGAGAIGSVFGAYLARAGINICVAQYGSMSTELRREIHTGSKLSGSYSFSVKPSQDKNYNLCLIATKAMQVLDVIKILKSSLTEKTDVIILSNGMGYHDQAKQLCKPARVFAAMTTEAAYFSTDRKIHHVAAGRTIIGPLSLNKTPIWLSSLKNALPNVIWEPDIETALWRKFAINCVINPLTAIYKCRNGELLTRPNLNSVVKNVCSEIEFVGKSIGVLTATDSLYDSVLHVIQNTAKNFSSMQQDIEHGRETEIESINGYLVHIASQVNIDTPLNKELLAKIREIHK